MAGAAGHDASDVVAVEDAADFVDVSEAPELPASPFSGTFWYRLGERFGTVSLRPKLWSDVRVKREGEEIRLCHLSTGTSLSITEDEALIVRQFDGTRTIAEMIIAEVGEAGRLSIEPVLGLLDRVVRADMLENFPPNMFRQLDAYLGRRAVELVRTRRPAAGAGDGVGDAAGGKLATFEQVPWRPKTPLLAERAQFLRSVELFRSLDVWTIGALAEAVHEETYPATSNIVVEGEQSNRFYVVRSGEVNVLKLDEDGLRKRVGKLHAGDYFGETGLLESSVRSATVRAGPSRPVQLYSFDPEVFERIISPHISAFRHRQTVTRRRERLAQVPLFKALSLADLERLASVVREHRVPARTAVVRQGEEGDRLYLVIDGSVGVVRDGVPVAKLVGGDFFGETALLFTTKRTASVITMEDSLLWSLDKDAFQQLLRGHLLGRRDLMPTVLNRLHR